MAQTNAERQAAWRSRRRAELDRLRKAERLGGSGAAKVKRAIETEQFELAADIRDRLRGLE